MDLTLLVKPSERHMTSLRAFSSLEQLELLAIILLTMRSGGG